ncbi:MAG: transglutaminase-like cysteine peptidase [Albidovulum sp.]|uniref:transglutaminase-like cysteine peptidase n=1 Tax=Albidovulum sp. TaxID=1872424 RepID=UPI003C8CB494
MFKSRNVGKGLATSVLILTAIVGFGLIGMAQPARSGTGTETHLVPRQPIAAPTGFNGVCDRYIWACARGGYDTEQIGVLHLAKTVNASVNRTTRAVSDRRQYGDEEVWALPTSFGGDCEDIVLLKKRELVLRGVAPESLLIATVLDNRRAAHAVLVLRTGDEDLVLDNLKNRILPWQKTGYSFLRMQNPEAPHKWDAVLAGGVFR